MTKEEILAAIRAIPTPEVDLEKINEVDNEEFDNLIRKVEVDVENETVVDFMGRLYIVIDKKLVPTQRVLGNNRLRDFEKRRFRNALLLDGTKPLEFPMQDEYGLTDIEGAREYILHHRQLLLDKSSKTLNDLNKK